MKLDVDIVIDCIAPERVADFWAAALGYDKVGCFEPYFLLVAPVKGFPSFVLRRVTEPKTSKTHGQLNIRADDVHREAERLERGVPPASPRRATNTRRRSPRRRCHRPQRARVATRPTK